MIKLSEADKLKYKDTPLVLSKMQCMICMVFPKIIIQKENTTIWQQKPNPIPSNRLYPHLKHKLECVAEEEVIRELYFIEPSFREEILRRDSYMC